jgi:uncharacterized protein (DUF427 family)
VSISMSPAYPVNERVSEDGAMRSRRIEPGPGRESVWDYPRPPRVEPCKRRVRVVLNGEVVAESTDALRVLETSSPPTIYIPAEDIRMEYLSPSEHSSHCEWKGGASYYDLKVGDSVSRDAAWYYRQPKPGFEQLLDHVAFYAGRVDAAYLGDELVTPQAGDFYGGWITSDIVGPFKGEPGTGGW